ncbi:protein NEDD1 isoform X1 [Cherax quadricarinatus]|uniref:protein NEDD1 isoform X1 n=1 Tax=Cherax quadricarinatus TaxID=27406 RepID=UPI00387E9FC7
MGFIKSSKEGLPLQKYNGSIMGDALLATAGDSVKLWHSQNYTLCQEIASENGRIREMTWNQDGQCLASLGETGKEILLSAVNAKSAANIGVVRGIDAPSCIEFASRSPQYLGVGNHSSVTIWNVKSQAQLKMYSVPDSNIAHISFSHNDSHITAATKKGSIFLLSVVNNSRAGPFKIFDNQAITDLAYSRVKKSLLGCCSEGGSVALFDSHANKVVHAFSSAHSSPASAILFSPVNELLMMSVGYDKKLACYNVQTKQPLMTHRSSAPLTSAAFLAGGQQVALGTMTGQVFIHDLRSIRPPIAVISAHNTAVTRVLLQPSSRSKSEGSVSGHIRKATQQKNMDTIAPAQIKLLKSCSGQPEEPNPNLNVKSFPSSNIENMLDVLSPIRHTESAVDQINPECAVEKFGGFDVCSSTESLNISILSPIRQTNQPLKGNFSPLALKLLSNSIDKDDLSFIRSTHGNDGAVSSLSKIPSVPWVNFLDVSMSPDSANNKENVQPTHASGQYQSVEMEELQANTSLVAFHKEGCLSPLHKVNDCQAKSDLNINETTCEKLEQTLQQVAATCSPEIKTFDQTNTNTNEASKNELENPGEKNACMDKTTAGSSQQVMPGDDSTDERPTEANSQPSAMEKRCHATESPLKKHSFLWPVQASDLVADSPDRPAHTEESCSSLLPMNFSDIQVELIRSCMAEVLEDFQDEVNRRLLHLQYVMTKQFFQQQEFMEQLHRQYSLNEDLLQENERLHKEISHLKAKY